jgi:rhodanese-related sulfurtransferase
MTIRIPRAPQHDPRQTNLRLEDDKGKVLAENDDISPQNLNSRIVFHCKQAGRHRIVTTSFQQAGRGRMC